MGECECVTIHSEWRYLYRTKKKKKKHMVTQFHWTAVTAQQSSKTDPPRFFIFIFWNRNFALLSSRSPWPLWCNLRRCQLWRVGLTFFSFSFCFHSIYVFVCLAICSIWYTLWFVLINMNFLSFFSKQLIFWLSFIWSIFVLYVKWEMIIINYFTNSKYCKLN